MSIARRYREQWLATIRDTIPHNTASSNRTCSSIILAHINVTLQLIAVLERYSRPEVKGPCRIALEIVLDYERGYDSYSTIGARAHEALDNNVLSD